MAWKDKRKLADGSCQEEFEEFIPDQMSKTNRQLYGV